jgi:hypothetical protein
MPVDRRNVFDDWRFAVAGYLCKPPHDGVVPLHQDPTMVIEDRYLQINAREVRVVQPGRGRSAARGNAE